MLDEPSNFEVHAVAFDMEDNTIQRQVSAKGTAHAVVAGSEKEGYKKVILYVSIACSGFEYNEEGGLDESLSYNNGVYDLYTGRALPTRSTTDDTTYDYTTTVEVDGVSYDLYYNKDVSWHWESPDGVEGIRFCDQVITFEVPKVYDGLVYCATDKVSYDPSTYSEEIDESEYYAMDLLNDESVAADTTVFFRFGTDIPA